MSAYGSFITEFPELHEMIRVWTKDDRSDERRIRVIYVPGKGEEIKRRKFTSGNTALDIVGEDHIYVNLVFKDKIKTGDYFLREGDNIIKRVVKEVAYSKAADYIDMAVQDVTGTTPDRDKELKVKEPIFA